MSKYVRPTALGVPAPASAPQTQNTRPERGSTALLLKRHAEKQKQTTAVVPPQAHETAKQKTGFARMGEMMQDIPADRILVRAQERQDFFAACLHLKKLLTAWGREIQSEWAGRKPTPKEHAGAQYWFAQARQAETALTIFCRVNGNIPAALEQLREAELFTYANALQSGCYVSLGL